MTALLDHIWRLMTFRHDLRGLDARHITTVAAVIALSCAASWWREKVRQIAGKHFVRLAPGEFALGAAA